MNTRLAPRSLISPVCLNKLWQLTSGSLPPQVLLEYGAFRPCLDDSGPGRVHVRLLLHSVHDYLQTQQSFAGRVDCDSPRRFTELGRWLLGSCWGTAPVPFPPFPAKTSLPYVGLTVVRQQKSFASLLLVLECHMKDREVLITPRHVSNLKTRDSRVGFIRKVYAILSCQLFIMAAVTWYLQTNRHATRYLLSDAGSWVLGLAGFASFASAAALLFPAVNRRVPLNFALLGLFTGGESVIVGAIAAMYRARSVLLALAQTGVATLGLTLFAFQKNPKYDLTRFGSSLGAALLIFASSLLVSSLFRVPVPEAAVGGIGALLFSVFLIYDTQMIVGGEKHNLQLSDKDYIRGAMEIYLDVTRLFIYLLKTFGSRTRSDDD